MNVDRRFVLLFRKIKRDFRNGLGCLENITNPSRVSSTIYTRSEWRATFLTNTNEYDRIIFHLRCIVCKTACNGINDELQLYRFFLLGN